MTITISLRRAYPSTVGSWADQPARAMPPTDFLLPCSPPTVATTEATNATNPSDDDLNNEDLNALLYIVVTLLFYSLGIVVGIITYLKREKREMEESKTFDLFMSMKNDENFNVSKQRRVQLVAARLEQLERAKMMAADRKERHRSVTLEQQTTAVSAEGADDGGQTEDKESSEDSDSISADRPVDLSVSDPSVADTDSVGLQLAAQPNVFQVSPSGEPISSVVAKIFDTERRGGLPNSPKALHLFNKNDRGRLSRDKRQDSMEKDTTSASGNSDSDNRTPLLEPEGCLVTNV